MHLQQIRTSPASCFQRGLASVTATAILCSLLAGCGQTGAPLPPSLQLPATVTDLSATRAADRVRVAWTMPHRTTDKIVLKGPQLVHICRRLTDGPCLPVAEVAFPPERPATYEDTLPAELVTGTPQLLAYSVEVRSRHGKSAGESNLAYTAAGAAPPSLANPRARITADGVLIEWQTAPLGAGDHKIALERMLLSPTATDRSEKNAAKAGPVSPLGSATPAPAPRQTLIVRLPPGPDSGRALDPDAAFDQHYKYRVSRVVTETLSGKSVEVESAPSAEITVDTKDLFAPAPPAGLAAVGSQNDKAIDLSWSPNTEPDLAGYAVYRSENGSASQRISGPRPLDSPAFRDATVQPGHRYLYAVTATDRDGNESAQSTPTEESLP